MKTAVVIPDELNRYRPGKVAVLYHQNAVRPEKIPHFAKARRRIGQMEQQEPAVDQVEAAAPQARVASVGIPEHNIVQTGRRAENLRLLELFRVYVDSRHAA